MARAGVTPPVSISQQLVRAPGTPADAWPHSNRRRVAAGVFGRRVDDGTSYFEVRPGLDPGEPAVSERPHAPVGDRGQAAEPDWDWTLDRQRGQPSPDDAV